MFNPTRRTLLKGMAYGSALSVAGLSAVATAASSKTETVTLFNQSDKTVTLNSSQPISLEQVNGWNVVKINKASEKSTEHAIRLDAGQRLSFAVDAEQAPLLQTTGDYIVITSEFSALNNMVPVSTYDAAVA